MTVTDEDARHTFPTSYLPFPLLPVSQPVFQSQSLAGSKAIPPHNIWILRSQLPSHLFLMCRYVQQTDLVLLAMPQKV